MAAVKSPSSGLLVVTPERSEIKGIASGDGIFIEDSTAVQLRELEGYLLIGGSLSQC